MSAKTFLILIKRCYTSSNYPGRQLSAVPPLPLPEMMSPIWASDIQGIPDQAKCIFWAESFVDYSNKNEPHYGTSTHDLGMHKTA